jgi:hypothetical protein
MVATSQEIALNIRTKVFGQQDVKALTATLTELRQIQMSQADVQKRVTAQTKLQTQQLSMSNQVLRAKVNLDDQTVRRLAAQQNIEQNLTRQFQNRLAVEREAIMLRQVAVQSGMKLSVENATLMATQNQKIIAAEEAATAAIRMKQRALMQVSISLFVMNISANQLVSSLKPLVKGNEAASQALTDFQGVLNLTLGPLQAYLALLQISNALHLEMKQTVTALGFALAAVMLFFVAVRQNSPAIRAALGAMSGALLALTLHSYQAALAQSVLGGAIQTAVAAVGGPVAFGIALAVAGAGLAFVIGQIAKAKSAQTRVGQMKRITRGGLAEVHEGEIFRPAAGEGGVGDMGVGGDITIFLPEGYQGSVSQSRFFAREVNRLVRTGQSSLKVKRKVVPSG